MTPRRNGSLRLTTRRQFLTGTALTAATGVVGCVGDGSDTAPSRPSPSLVEDIAMLSFEGTLFDTHAHWVGARDAGHEPLSPGPFAETMASNDVGGCVLFTSSVDVEQEYERVLQALDTDAVAYVPFIQPDSRNHLSADNLIDVYEGRSEPFFGIGEVIFYGGPLEGTALTDDPWPRLFEFAGQEDLAIMVHPTTEQAEGLVTMLSRYPDAVVMGHGHELMQRTAFLTSLLADHENLYWTVDFASLANGLTISAAGPQDFVQKYDANGQRYVSTARSVAADLLNAAPARVMWGTDAAATWNLDSAVYDRIMSFTDDVLSSIPDAWRSSFAYENAVRLFDA